MPVSFSSLFLLIQSIIYVGWHALSDHSLSGCSIKDSTWISSWSPKSTYLYFDCLFIVSIPIHMRQLWVEYSFGILVFLECDIYNIQICRCATTAGSSSATVVVPSLSIVIRREGRRKIKNEMHWNKTKYIVACLVFHSKSCWKKEPCLLVAAVGQKLPR